MNSYSANDVKLLENFMCILSDEIKTNNVTNILKSITEIKNKFSNENKNINISLSVNNTDTPLINSENLNIDNVEDFNVVMEGFIIKNNQSDLVKTISFEVKDKKDSDIKVII